MNWMIDLFALNDLLMIAGVVFLAMLVQSLTGFGSGLVSMPLLIAIIGLKDAVPFMAVLGLFFDLVLFIHYRKAIDLAVVLKLSIPALVSIPLGIIGLRVFNETVMLGALGFIVLGYALYALLNFRVPKLKSPYWAYGAGFLGGLLGGAYNIPGPPVIIYADSQQWPIDEFKGNLQGFFFVIFSVAVISHGMAQNLSPSVFINSILVLPALLLGYWAGIRLEKKLNPVQFRKAVLFLLLVIGARLVFIS